MAATPKAKLLNNRRAIKGQLTRLDNYLVNVRDMQPEEVSRSHIINLQTRLHSIDKLQSNYNEVQNEIDLLSDDKELEGQTIERDNVNETCYRLISEYTLFVETYERPAQLETPNLNHSNHSSDNISNRQIVSDIKLPTIQLPRFDGAYDKWLEFNDIYNALIHNNGNLSNIQKFYYLKSALSGEAANVIQSVEITDANYIVAWQLLSDRYKNDALIINSYVRAMFELPELTRDSSTGLRNLCDSISKNIRCLQTLKQPVDQWDVLLVYLITSKLDNNTNREWQQERSKQTNLATFAELKTFLTRKCTALEGLQDTKNKIKSARYSNSNTYANKAHTASYISVDKTCTCCKDAAHPLYYCMAFKQMPVQTRIAEVKKQRLCYNCLSDNHVTRNCQSIHCRRCNGFHHTLLHLDTHTNNYAPNANAQRSQQSAKSQIKPHPQEKENPIPTTDLACNSNINSNENINSNTATNAQTSNQPMITNHSITNTYYSEVILSTAIIDVRTTKGDYMPCRVLLDPGSQSNCITFQTCKNLNLPVEKTNVTLHGLNAASSTASSRTNITFKSKHSNYTKTISCLILKQITEHLPLTSFNKNSLNIPNNIQLADPNFYKSSNIDILIGAQLYLSLLSVGQISLNDHGLAMQKTKLGWILGGQLNHISSPTKRMTCLNVSKLETLVNKFWECETIPEEKVLNSEEQLCEEHFKTSTYRNKEGKFVVKFPFCNDVRNLGSSRIQTLDRFHALERKLNSDSKLKEAYKEFMREYIDLKHMQKCTDEPSSNELTYHLPHHPVVKPTNLTTKVRVVFDASCSTNRGNSLNSMQLTGAILQSDLYSILLRFRQHEYVMIADIEKMYRQILMHPDHRRFLRIFWREDESLPLDCFELNTLTYGTTSAPFIATRCLFELAEQAKQKYPSASEIIKNDFYMDDLVTGARTLEELHTLKTNITDILNKAHFPLRKWLSNDARITTETKTNINLFNLNDELASKTLGILWDSRADTLQCNELPGITITKTINKRSILSQTAQLFDPLGLYSPVIIIPKIILQELWQLQLSWDESVPQDISYRWQNFQTQLPLLTTISQPRFVLHKDYDYVELHGFADASMKAYGACVYVRSANKYNDICVHLLTAKSRVAPLKTLTLPRLELCAAVLLSNLMRKVRTALRLQFSNIFYWSDSTVTLCWIKSNSNRWKTFVANRVAKIQNHSSPKQWGHVKSEENPADYISRGIWPQDLQKLNMWWSGPKWLLLDSTNWPAQSYTLDTDNTEQKTTTLILNSIEKLNVLTNYSSFTKLTRIIAYCLRFIANCKLKELKINSPLKITELNNAIITIVKLVQQESFATELKQLENNTLTLKHKFANLSVFRDEQGVLRVGGRLKNSNFDFNKRHPMLLPHNHHVTQIIAEYEHIRLLHCGPQALLYAMRERFWPLNGRNLTRQIVHKCIKCFRANPKTISYQMGNLPLDRLTPTIPFATCGIDYAGPINIRDRMGRGYKVSKAYICLFVCFSTKAIHLDLVTDLTTEAFIATFRRFVARRGKPNDVYSDNATNFVGANKELAKLAEFFVADNKDIEKGLTNIGIKWHFIPPRSPNFGGLWEAGVKSAKLHLKRVLGEALLTYEKLLTILVQIEAILNSRPLTPLNSNPNDMQPLTPAHFLIGKSLTTLADTDYFHVPTNRLGAYQHQQKMVQDFWKRWQTEYISNLQTKTKWKLDPPNSNIEIGDMVILKDNNLPPLRWKLGRIKEKHAGADGRTRVVTVHLPDNSTMKRAVTQLCPLPKE